MTQGERILRHLEDFGSITSAEAMADYGIMRLASRVNDLRREGHPIITEVVTGKNRYGEPTRWARYRMGGEGMTREEVLRGLECRSRIGITGRDCENCPYGMQMARLWGCNLAKLSCDALALLKAQEQVKPIENAGFYYCGACKYAFTSAKQKYCSDCGRKVKWE